MSIKNILLFVFAILCMISTFWINDPLSAIFPNVLAIGIFIYIRRLNHLSRLEKDRHLQIEQNQYGI
jgi:hypothetical protein